VRHLDLDRHRINDSAYVASCREQLCADGALVLPGFFTAEAISTIVAESAPREVDAYYANSTHNVWLTPNNPALPTHHVFNRQIVSSKGLIADDQIAAGSPLREVYASQRFRDFLSSVLGIAALHPYDDEVSSINVHFASAGRELGWHFDNSSFAVTMLLQAPEAGGRFEYVANVRDAAKGEQSFDRVERVLDGHEPVSELRFEPGDLVLFRGRDSMHRVTPTKGGTTRMLTVFAFNDAPGIALSESALNTFYGRTC